MRRLPLPLMGSLLAVLLTAVVGVATAGPALAHTRLVSSAPAQGVPAEAPAEVTLVFSDPVQPGLSAVSVTGADGQEQVEGAPTSPGDATSVTQALRAPLAPGTYRVAYRVLAADGHPVTGTLEITATAPPAAPTAAPTTAPTSALTATPPTPEEAPTTGPVEPAADESDADGGLPVLPLAVGGLVVAGAAGLLARRFGAPPKA